MELIKKEYERAWKDLLNVVRVGRGGMGQRGEMGQLILFIINGYWETFFKIFLPLSMDH